MKLSVERLPESQVQLDIAADEDEFARAMDRAARKVAGQVNVPGFRPGKAPRAMIERLYGRGIFLEEAHKDLMEDLYRRALKQEEMVPVGDPHVDIVAVEPLAFRVTVPVYPTVDPGPYRDVRAEPAEAGIDEAAVDEVLERMRRSQSPWVDPPSEGMELGPDKVLVPKQRTPREGDQVTIDLRVMERDQPFQEPVEDAVFVLGESNLFDRLREEIEQLRVGETARFTIAFAEDDETVNPEIRGRTLDYTVTLKGLKERDLLPLDDDFAQTVAETETLEQLRRDLRDDLHQGKTTEARTAVVNRIINAMAETATIDLPAPMIDEAVDDDLQTFRQQLAQNRRTLEEYLRLNNQTEEELRAELRPDAARRLRNSLLLRAIAEREAITVEDADLDAEIERLVGPATGDDPNADRRRELYGSDYFRRILRNDLFERRITERLIEIATEGRGAVLNGWVEPEPTPESNAEATTEPAAAAGGAPDADAADAVTDEEPDPTVTVAEAHAGEGEGDDHPAQAPEAAQAPAAPDAAPGGTDTGADALHRALTLGTMSGQPGDLAATAPAGVGAEDVAVQVADVVAEPDAAQAAAVGHARENAAVAAAAPDEAITPEELEAQGPPDTAGSLPNPSY